MTRWLLILATCLCAQLSFAADWQYTIRPGDDLWSIVKRYCGDMEFLPAIAQHNNLMDANGIKPIRAGQRIAIPTQYLAFAPSQAKVRAVTGLVRIHQCINCASPQIRARGNESLFMNYVLITSDTGAALIEFADGSLLAVQPNSRVIFDKLTAFGPAGMVDTHLRFVHGRGRAFVQKQNQSGGFRISTPEGIAAVRGTEFRVGYQATQSKATTETLEGAVSFHRNRQSTDLPAGYGVSVSPAGLVKETLLTPPTGLANYAMVSQQQTLSWSAIQGAAGYVSEWSHQSEPDVVIARAEHSRSELTVDREPGDYVLRVRGLSATGIEGFDASQAVQILALAPVLEPALPGQNGLVAFGWDYPETDTAFEVTITPTHDAPPISINVDAPNASTLLEAGHYEWQVAADGSAKSAPGQFTVVPEAPTNVQVKRHGKRAQIVWNGDENTRYKLTLRHISKDLLIVDKLVTGSMHDVDLPHLGRYQIELATVTNDVHSPTTSTTVTRAWPAWWLLLALPILVI